MRSMTIADLAAISLCAATSVLAVQAVAHEQPAVIQTQANPPGAGIPSDTPPNPATADTPVPPAMPADPSYRAGPYKGALTPAPLQAMDKVYPLCTRTLQDSCVNPGEAGVRPYAATPRHRSRARRANHSH